MSIPILSDIISKLEQLITEHGSAAVLKEHVALLKTKAALFEKDIEELKKENAKVIKENAELKQELARQHKSEEFVEARGALFKRLPSGGYSETPYCPNCHETMFYFQSVFPYECSNQACGHIANFKGAELHHVLDDLPK